jgi:hypothetical protein
MTIGKAADRSTTWSFWVLGVGSMVATFLASACSSTAAAGSSGSVRSH